ncbi:MAG TPA: biotin/lipoyl-containing protein, partial [Ktedonobacteraceae bacterium]|nr:biotin/lipoyl-containing protein [Ktedonobacteraceae bacterium]
METIEKPVTMPKLGMTMTEGTVLNWLYREGDWVEKGEPLVEVMTDKVNMEVEAPFKGRLVHILAQEGEVLPIGAPLAMLASETAGISNPPTPAVPAPVRQEQVSSTAIPPTISTNTTNRTSLPIASTPAAKREAAQHGIELSAVIEAGARPPLDRADILAFVQRGNHQKREIQPGNL